MVKQGALLFPRFFRRDLAPVAGLVPGEFDLRPCLACFCHASQQPLAQHIRRFPVRLLADQIAQLVWIGEKIV